MEKLLKQLLAAALIAVVGCGSFAATAQQQPYRFAANLRGGLYINNRQAWSLEGLWQWQFSRYVGAGMGIEMASQYLQDPNTITINGQKATLSKNDCNVAWILFKPSLVLRSPYLINHPDGDFSLWLEALPGLSLGFPSRNSVTYEFLDIAGLAPSGYRWQKFNNHGVQWLFWRADVAVKASIDRWVAGAGYEVSNLDYYSGHRNVTLPDGSKFAVPRKQLSHKWFVSIGFMF